MHILLCIFRGGMCMYRDPNQPHYYYYQQPPQPFYRHERQQPNVPGMMQILRTQHNNLYNQLEQAGMNRAIIDYIFSLLVGFTLNQANTNQTAAQIYQAFQRQVPWLGLLLRQMNVPQNVADRVFTRVIQLTLNELGQGGGQPSDGVVRLGELRRCTYFGSCRVFLATESP